MIEKIRVVGGREHNLKNINLEIPKNTLTVVTGVSGSGKSSLAFDTIYAEGQRRYLQSLSSYARQFLGMAAKPEVDYIEGLSPAISIDQKSRSHNPRSTVGTVTEIYDYLRLLFARVGEVFCPKCRIKIAKLSPQEMVEMVWGELEEEKKELIRVAVWARVAWRRKGEFKGLGENLLAKGYEQVVVDGERYDLTKSSEFKLEKTVKHTIEVMVDELGVERVRMSDKTFGRNLKRRLGEGIEQALKLSGGVVKVVLNGREKIFSEHFACPRCGWSMAELEPRIFSFNSPLGACSQCKGLGTIFRIDEGKILNKELSLNQGGLLPFSNLAEMDTWYARLIKTVAKREGVDLDKAIKDLPEEKLKLLLYGTGKTYMVYGTNRFGRETVIREKFNGVVADLERKFFEGEGEVESHYLGKYFKEVVCDGCQGRRLNEAALSVRVGGLNIAEVSGMTVERLRSWVEGELKKELDEYRREVAGLILREIGGRLKFLEDVGLGYLTLDRRAKTLSGGESQRIRLASQLGTGLTGVLYVLDEPSVGLHPKDVRALLDSLQYLRDLGNTLVVVEHDRETMLAADYLVELGPGSGDRGGRVVFAGFKEEYRRAKTITTRYLFGGREVGVAHGGVNLSQGYLRLKGVKHNNLKSLTVSFPLGNLVVVTGVSGSGKSSLVVETLYPALKFLTGGFYQGQMGEVASVEGYERIERVRLVDQSSIGRTPRSNVATYMGIFGDIREIFAKTLAARERGFSKGRFSFNLKGGRCERCEGAGVMKIEMQFLADMYVKCPVCKGKRYNSETLEVTYRGKTIAEVLEMTVREAAEFFKAHDHIYRKLRLLEEIGLDYIRLGQPAPTFSGGEAQRIKIAAELGRRGAGRTVYILDEPTTGLHFADVQKLMESLYKLVEAGNTVVVIEHNLEVIKNSQYVIELGPEGGERGGYLLYQGELEGLREAAGSPTAEYLFERSRG